MLANLKISATLLIALLGSVVSGQNVFILFMLKLMPGDQFTGIFHHSPKRFKLLQEDCF
jgi:hypothetical protein